MYHQCSEAWPLYQIWYNSRKQCISNTYAKTAHFHISGNRRFLLVEALPQSPQNTELCSGNAGKFQRLRDFANRCGELIQ